MNFGNIKNLAAKAADAAKNATEKVENKVKEVDAEKIKAQALNAVEYAKNAASNVEESIKNFDSEEAKKTIKNLPNSGLNAVKKHINDMAETSKATKEALNSSNNEQIGITVEGALQIMYLLANADCKFDDTEKNKFDEAENEIDSEKKIDKKALTTKCNELIEKAKGEEYKEILLDDITDIIIENKSTDEKSISNKLLMWNLLAMSYSDGEYSKDEKDIIRAVARRLQIEKNIIQEMELALQTIISISKEKEQLPEETKELDNRISVIMQSIQQLIGD